MPNLRPECVAINRGSLRNPKLAKRFQEFVDYACLSGHPCWRESVVLRSRYMNLLRSLTLVLIFVCGILPRIEVNGSSGSTHSEKAPVAINARGVGHQFRVSRRTNSMQLSLLSKDYWSNEMRPARSLSSTELQPATPSNRLLLALFCRLRL
jgi:hypothetical protein